MRYLFLLVFLFPYLLAGQDTAYVKDVVRKLASEKMAGRGYVKNGDKKAAKFISKEFSKAGLEKFRSGWFQDFSFQVNTFPGDAELETDGRELVPGKDFIFAPGSPSIEGSFSVFKINRSLLTDSAAVEMLQSFNFPDAFILLDDSGMTSGEKAEFRKLESNPFGAAGIIMLKDKLTWSVSQKQASYPVVEVLRDSWKSGSRVEIELEAKLKMHDAVNVIGYVPGTISQDSLIVFTAHYDHLGMMGEDAIFYGANDNASGTATLIDLARHYKNNPAPYPVAFIAFAGEETGLIGSHHFVENPVFPIEKIKVLINLDLMGNGSEGIMVVNGAIHEEDFRLMEEINQEKSLLTEIRKRGKAANSDHYFFSEKGVKAFFIYTLGGSSAYHDIYDNPDSIAFDEYRDIFTLITTYVSRLGL